MGKHVFYKLYLGEDLAPVVTESQLLAKAMGKADRAVGMVRDRHSFMAKFLKIRAENRKGASKTPPMFKVMLTDCGLNKIAAIKWVREIANLGLKEAKDLCDAVEGGRPQLVKETDQATGEHCKKLLNEAGASARLVLVGAE